MEVLVINSLSWIQAWSPNETEEMELSIEKKKSY